MRTLIYIPIVHLPEDMGSQSEAIKTKYIAIHGIPGWQRHIEEVEELWRKIGERLRRLPLAGRKVRIYQDGLPVCEREAEIVRKGAEAGSRNHQLLIDLMREGGVLTGTEDPKLLLEEHERISKGSDTEQAVYDQLMERRDRFIAARIDKTLEEGEIGILFIGALHRVEKWLPKDIEVQDLLRDLQGSG